ncbi:MAG TPA: HDOD domain-containing protein [Tepidisphaeraceae bacterium]|jgi:HD-like signal output (HDOD) protein|nr:HDOD domain-containing protein [Tepidisphaeraceae bacterium]
MGTTPLPESQSIVSDAVRKVTMLATLPEVTSRIIRTVEDPKSTASALHKIVSHDPALVTRILKVVNSSFYGLPGQIGSIERAIVLLGLNAVKNIAVAASLGQMFRGATLCEGYTAKDLWTHCVAVAVTSRELAKQMKVSLADEAFLAGMIHDVGLLVSLQLWPEKLRNICDASRTGQQPFCEIERAMVGVDHQQLGMGLAEQWKFPRSCQLVAGFHHQPQVLSDDSRTLVTIVHVADTICCGTAHGFPLTAAHQTLDARLLADAHITPAIVESVKARHEEILQAAEASLG